MTNTKNQMSCLFSLVPYQAQPPLIKNYPSLPVFVFKEALYFLFLFFTSICIARGQLSTASQVKSSVSYCPIQKDAPVKPGVVVVKKRTPLDKGSQSRWQRTLQRVRTRSVSPAFPSHAGKASPLASIYHVEVPSETDVYQAAEQLMEDPEVAWAEPVYIRRLSYDPNDPQIGIQWHIAKTQCPLAWDLFQGDTTVVIGIVDTGIELDHPDLKANLWRNPGEIPDNGIDDDSNGYVDDVVGWDFGNNDNNPNPRLVSSASDRYHGTNVAGTASAVTDNIVGVAAPAFNAKVMAVKATEDEDDEQSVKFAYQGIAYAADQGADVINCSFGGPGASNAERTVIEYAYSLGIVIVAAAGNDGKYGSDYPAAYREVLSVAATDRSDNRTYFTNYGQNVDISAPGQSIYTTDRKQDYAYVSGTSFASPVAAGIAALVKGYHPDWAGDQVKEQIRVSAFPIGDAELGWGRVDAYRALTFSSPAIRIQNVDIQESLDNNQDGIVDPGETAEIVFELKNFLSPSGDISIDVSTTNSDVVVENSHFSFAGLNTLEVTSNIEDPLRIYIGEQAERGQEVLIQVQIQTDTYSDQDHFSFQISPDYQTIEARHVQLTLSSTGRLGFTDYPDNVNGVGFVYQDLENLLFEGAFMAAVSPDSVSDVARGPDGEIANTDFSATPEGELVLIKSGEFGDSEAYTTFNDRGAVNAVGIKIKQTAYAFDNDVDGDYILLTFTMTPDSNQTIQGLYAGLFMDWDVGENGLNSTYNLPGFDETNQLAYIYDSMSNKNMHGGLRIFSNGYNIQYASIYNPDDIWDGYTDQEKWNHLTGGIQPIVKNDPNDHSHLLGVGPINLAPNDTAMFGYAVLAGESLNDLKNNASAALLQWESLALKDTVPGSGAEPDTNFVLYPPKPNPFIGKTEIPFEIPATAHVTISVFDLLGRLVVRLLDQTVTVDQMNIQQSVVWDGYTKRGIRTASGIYFICLEYLTYRKVQKVIILGND
ncbi:S8 family serine peptidase [bacterium]|nr:S8 family serine peptidase [bacterium]